MNVRIASRLPRFRGILFAGIIAGTISAGVAFANPQGGKVRHGRVEFQNRGGSLVVRQTSDKAILEWSDFSIRAGERTTFLQPSRQSAVLNRVPGGPVSRLEGRLEANGQVYLINPSGIVVGPGGAVNTAGFVASTRDVDDAEFLAGGDLRFSGDSPGDIVNEGRIAAVGGDVVLIARSVRNPGTVEARGGTAGLAAGDEVLLKAKGDERLFVLAGRGGADEGVGNSGVVRAAQAELKAAGGNAYQLAINHTGLVDATTVSREGGRVILRADGGKVKSGGRVQASGRKGGEVRVQGDDITLSRGGSVVADGEEGGGEVRIGGGFQGASVGGAPGASRVAVEAGAEIRADGGSRGDGGSVVVWSDGSTVFSGTILARGGSEGGDGGSVEVSGKRTLGFEGLVDVGAPRGEAGSLLLDPFVTSTVPDYPIPGPGTYFPAVPGMDSFFSPAALAAALKTGHVTLDSDSYISFGHPVFWRSIYDLILNASHVYFDANVVSKGGGQVIIGSGGAGSYTVKPGVIVTGVTTPPGSGSDPGSQPGGNPGGNNPPGGWPPGFSDLTSLIWMNQLNPPGGDFFFYAGGFGGSDGFYGTGGNDFHATGFDDFFYSGGYAGSDSFYGTAANDFFYAGGSGGSDGFYGSGSNDFLLGGGGNDYLYGAGGNDYLFGGGGNDSLLGGGRNDFFFGQGGGGNDFIDRRGAFELDGEERTKSAREGNDVFGEGGGRNGVIGEGGEVVTSGGGGGDWQSSADWLWQSNFLGSIPWGTGGGYSTALWTNTADANMKLDELERLANKSGFDPSSMTDSQTRVGGETLSNLQKVNIFGNDQVIVDAKTNEPVKLTPEQIKKLENLPLTDNGDLHKEIARVILGDSATNKQVQDWVNEHGVRVYSVSDARVATDVENQALAVGTTRAEADARILAKNDFTNGLAEVAAMIKQQISELAKDVPPYQKDGEDPATTALRSALLKEKVAVDAIVNETRLNMRNPKEAARQMREAVERMRRLIAKHAPRPRRRPGPPAPGTGGSGGAGGDPGGDSIPNRIIYDSGSAGAGSGGGGRSSGGGGGASGAPGGSSRGGGN